MRAILLIFILSILYSNISFSQSTGTVNYKYLGVSFTIPDGWMGQEAEDSYLLSSNTIPGLIIMLSHDDKYTMAQMEQTAKEGISEEGGTNLNLSGQLERIGTDALGGEFSGTLEWTAANAYIIGKLNPIGNGVSIIAITTKEQYDGKYKKYATQLANSLRFTQAAVSPAVTQFHSALNGREIKYLDTFGDASNGGSDVTQIQLCSSGTFYFYSSSSISAYSQSESIDNGVAVEDTYSGYSSSGPNNKEGTWKITNDGNGNPILELSCSDGKVIEYDLSYGSKKELLLDGVKYYLAGEAQCN